MLSAAATLVFSVVLRPLGAFVLRVVTFGRANFPDDGDPPRNLWPVVWREGNSLAFTPIAASSAGFAFIVLVLVALSAFT